MVKKRCVVCDEVYTAEVDRSDNVTCSIACRSKLHRMRRKAEEKREARLLSSNQEVMMLWLKRYVPEATHSLRKLKAIHGKEAFDLASTALQALGRHTNRDR